MKALWKIALLSALAVTACTVEEEKPDLEHATQEIPAGYHLVTLKAGKVCDDPSLKTTYDSDKVFSWTSGDAISVLFNNGAANKFFSFTTSGTGASATFTGLVEDGYDYEGALGGTKWALFPASANHEYHSDTDIKFYIPEGDDGSVCNIPMIAQNAGTEYLFHHLCGAIKFTFRGLEANQNVKLTFDSRSSSRYTAGLFNIQKLSTGISNAIITGNQKEDGAVKTRYVTATADAAGTAFIYMPLPLSETQESEYPDSHYWTSFYFDLWNTDVTPDGHLLEIHPGGGKSFMISKGKITVMGSKRVSGSEPCGGITIDGDFSDWNAHTERYIGNFMRELKATADRNYLYIYQRFINSNCSLDTGNKWNNYQWVYFDTDNDVLTGTDSSDACEKGSDKYWEFYFNFMDASAPYRYKFIESSWGITKFTESSMYRWVQDANKTEIEYCIPLSELGVVPDPSSATEFAIGLKIHLKDNGGSTQYVKTKRLSITVPGPSPASPAPGSPFSLTEATEDYMNPERGLYNQTSFYFDGSSIPSLSISSSHVEPLEMVLFYLNGYRDKYNLDDEVIDAIGTVFTNLRNAGKKAIVRFGYTSAHGEGDKPWDAGIYNIRHHIEQITPKLTANEDIIYVVQAGFIGTYGEWYYTTDDFNYSVAGKTLENYGNRAQVITDLLAAVPASRQVALRQPLYKRAYFKHLDPSNVDIDSWEDITNLDMDDANKRLSFFNDAFLANNTTDTGTFNQPEDWDMWEEQSPYLINGGETAYQSEEPDPDYCNRTRALNRIGNEHISYLNKNTDNKIMAYWIANDYLEDIKKALGYRLVATEASVDYSSTALGARVDFSISILNNGSVRVIYPRPFKLVYIHLGEPTVVKDLGEVRDILPGNPATVISGYFNLPNAAEAGDKLAIWLPDNATGLQNNASYSIRLANSDISWESGYNIIYTF